MPPRRSTRRTQAVSEEEEAPVPAAARTTKRKRAEPSEEEPQTQEPKRGRTKTREKAEASAEPKRGRAKKNEPPQPESVTLPEPAPQTAAELPEGKRGKAKKSEQPSQQPVIDVAAIATAVAEAMKAGMEANHGEVMERLNRLEERVAAMANAQAVLLAQLPRPTSHNDQENTAPAEQAPPSATQKPASPRKQCSFGDGSKLERYLEPKATEGIYITDMKGLASPGEPNTSKKGRRSSGIKWSILFADETDSGSRRKSSIGAAPRSHQRSKSLCIPRT